ncbi:MAG: hypothetical protein GY915_05145, partial [bacterium]|nr:hypothetical protein [bacterium]
QINVGHASGNLLVDGKGRNYRVDSYSNTFWEADNILGGADWDQPTFSWSDQIPVQYVTETGADYSVCVSCPPPLDMEDGPGEDLHAVLKFIQQTVSQDNDDDSSTDSGFIDFRSTIKINSDLDFDKEDWSDDDSSVDYDGPESKSPRVSFEDESDDEDIEYKIS